MVATVTRLKAAAMTVHYFEADGYYARAMTPSTARRAVGTARRWPCSACTGRSSRNASRPFLLATFPAPTCVSDGCATASTSTGRAWT